MEQHKTICGYNKNPPLAADDAVDNDLYDTATGMIYSQHVAKDGSVHLKLKSEQER